MFLMMRFCGGCCGGHRHSGNSHSGRAGHGEHGDGSYQVDYTTRDREGRTGTGQARDPVCGMMLDKEEAVYRIYGGEEYYFCSEDCARIFEARRERRANI